MYFIGSYAALRPIGKVNGESQIYPLPQDLHSLNFKDQTPPMQLHRGHLPMCQISLQ